MPAPHVVGRRRRASTRALPRGHVRRGPEAPVGLPPHEVRVREDRPRASRRSRGASTAPPSSSATPRPARWTRSTGPTTSSRRSRSCATGCREWVPLIGPELGYTNIVPVDFVAKAMDHIAHQPDLDGQAFHLPSRSRSARATCSTRSRAPRTRRRWRCASTRSIIDALPKGTFSMLMKLPALKDVAALAPGRLRHPRRGRRARRLHRPVRHARHRARAGRLRHRGPRRSTTYADQALGLLGAQPRPGPLQGPLVRARRSTAGPW